MRLRVGTLSLLTVVVWRVVLSPLNASPVVDTLVAALEDPVPQVRAAAAWALGEIGAREALPYLIAALDDRDDVVTEVARALQKMSPIPAEAVSRLLDRLESKAEEEFSDPFLMYEIAQTLAYAPPETIPALIDALVTIRTPMALRYIALALALGDVQEAIPVIGEMLLNDPDPDVREAMASALGYFGSVGEAVFYLIEALSQEEDPLVRTRIIQALWKLKSPEAVPVLVAALADRERLVRKSALTALKVLGQDAAPAVPALVETLREAARDTQQWYDIGFEIREVLVAIGDNAGQEVASLLGSPDPKLRAEGARILGKIRAREFVPELVALLSDPELKVRAAAAWALAQMGSAALDAVPYLIDLLTDPDKDVRESAGQTLCALGREALPALEDVIHGRHDIELRIAVVSILGCFGEDGCQALVRALSCPDWRIRREAASQFGQLLYSRIIRDRALYGTEPDWARGCVEEAFPELLALVEDPLPAVRLAATRALTAILDYTKDIDLEKIASVLGKLLDDSHSDVAAMAAHGLGSLGSAALPFLSKLIAALDDVSFELREQAARAVGQLGPAAKDAVPKLIKLLKNPDRDVRLAAAQALGRIGAEEAIPTLAALLDDCDWRVREAAVKALGALGQKAIPHIKLALEDDKVAVQKAAVEALARIGPRAVPALLEALKHLERNVRLEAVRALGKLRAVEAVPALIALREGGEEIDKAAMKALVRIGRPALSHLQELLASTDPGDRRFAAAVMFAIDFLPSFVLWASGVIGAHIDVSLLEWEELPLPTIEGAPPRPGQVLETYLNAELTELRAVALVVMTELGRIAREVPEVVRAYAADPDQISSLSLLSILLDNFYSSEALTVLEGLLMDVGQGEVVKVAELFATELIRMLSGLITPLEELLCHRDVFVRALAAEALGLIGPQAGSAVPALIGKLKDPEPLVRSAAARALGQILRHERRGDGGTQTHGGGALGESQGAGP